MEDENKKRKGEIFHDDEYERRKRKDSTSRNIKKLHKGTDQNNSSSSINADNVVLLNTSADSDHDHDQISEKMDDLYDHEYCCNCVESSGGELELGVFDFPWLKEDQIFKVDAAYLDELVKGTNINALSMLQLFDDHQYHGTNIRSHEDLDYCTYLGRQNINAPKKDCDDNYDLMRSWSPSTLSQAEEEEVEGMNRNSNGSEYYSIWRSVLDIGSFLIL